MHSFVEGRGGAVGGGVDREIQDSSFLSYIPNKKSFRYFHKISKNNY